jgi:Zn-dependent protease
MKIGSIGGIPITVDVSWFLIAALIVYSNWATLERSLGSGTALSVAVLTAVLFLGSVLGHELAHAWMARARKLEVSGIRLYALGGETATQMGEKPVDEFLVTVVGPLTSVGLGLAMVAASTVGSLAPAVRDTLHWVGWLNVVLGAANLAPGFPLDGGRILHAIIWKVTGNERKANTIAAWSGMVVWAGAIAFGLYLFSQDEQGFGLWILLIGLMMFQGARQTLQRDKIIGYLGQGTVAEAMGPPPQSIPSDITLSDALDRYLRGHEEQTFLVSTPFEPIAGLLTFEAAAEIGRENPLRPVRDAMRPANHLPQVRVTDRLDAVVHRLQEAGGPAVVVQDGQVVGSIAIGDVDRWLRARPVRQND